MNMNQEDAKIKRLYDCLRSENEADVPDFHSLLARPRQPIRQGMFVFRHRVILGLLALMLVVGPIMYLSVSSEPVVSENADIEVATISSWESPTQFLLDDPNSSLWESIPSIESDLAGWDDKTGEAN